MRDIDRIEPLYKFLAKVHKENFPDWRFGQFVSNFAGFINRDIFYLEDDMLEDKINKYISQMKTHEKHTGGKR